MVKFDNFESQSQISRSLIELDEKLDESCSVTVISDRYVIFTGGFDEEAFTYSDRTVLYDAAYDPWF